MEHKKIKSFREQFKECRLSGFCRNGKLVSFKDHPELMPFCPTKRNKMIKANCESIREITCGRFGGSCRSTHRGCRKLRGMI